MSIDPVQSSSFPARPPAAPAASPSGGEPFAAALTRAQEPAPPPPVADGPPPTALAAMGVAGEAYAKLRAADRELRFEPTSHGVRIAVYDGDGKLIQRVPATDVLRMASGEKTWLA